MQASNHIKAEQSVVILCLPLSSLYGLFANPYLNRVNDAGACASSLFSLAAATVPAR